MKPMKKHTYNQPIPPNKYNPLAWIHPQAVIGKNCWIGSDVYIGPNVVIGDEVSISNGVNIYDHDTSWYRVSEGKREITRHAVRIGSFTQVGSNTVIVPRDEDINIGHHVIVGALSLVKKSIPSNSMAYGIPAVAVRYIDKEIK